MIASLSYREDDNLPVHSKAPPVPRAMSARCDVEATESEADAAATSRGHATHCPAAFGSVRLASPRIED
jgi:hypothetical protein